MDADAPGRPTPGHDPRFRSTRWGVVLAAAGGPSAEAHEALADLCAECWYPLYSFARRRGHGPEAAEDLVQGYFARLLEKGDLAAVDRARGRFRSYLVAAFTHYMSNRADYDRAARRGGGRRPLSIDRLDAEGRYAAEPAHGLTAERLFDRRWALSVLDRVLGRLAAEMAARGESRRFEALRPALLGDGGRAPYAAIGATLGIAEAAARAAASRLRRRYRELLREEVAGTLRDPAEADDEIRDLFEALDV